MASQIFPLHGLFSSDVNGCHGQMSKVRVTFVTPKVSQINFVKVTKDHCLACGLVKSIPLLQIGYDC